MCNRWVGTGLLLAALTAAGPGAGNAAAQLGSTGGPLNSTQGNLSWAYSGNSQVNAPLPIGPEHGGMEGGVFFAGEFLMFNQPRAMGRQQIAESGFIDSDGSIGATTNALNQVITNGTPGTYYGSHLPALDTQSFGRTTWTPGWRVTAGYAMDGGETSFSGSYMFLFDGKYSAGASGVHPGFQSTSDLADTYLYSPVFGYAPTFSGPAYKIGSILNTTAVNTGSSQPTSLIGTTIVPIGSGNTPSGIWNGATTEDINYQQRYTGIDITMRQNVLDSEYAHTYTLAGGRFAWIWERFAWNTVDQDIFGNSSPQDAVLYTNIMSQRMYGPFGGCGSDIYLGNAFALSVDTTGALLYDIVKERDAYLRGDLATQAKRVRIDYSIVPEATASMNLSWYPLEGLQIRVGYQAMAFFNTIYMAQPVGFDVGAIDPAYKHRVIRLFQGGNAGIGFVF